MAPEPYIDRAERGPRATRSAAALAPEEAGRARIYGLLARLFRAPPGEELLEAIAGAGELDVADAAIAGPWLELACAAAWTDAATLRAEYERAFAGRRRTSPQRLSGACAALRAAIRQQSLDLSAQERLFRRSVPAAQRSCERVIDASSSRFYVALGRFASAFFRLERAAFALPDHPEQQRSLEQ